MPSVRLLLLIMGRPGAMKRNGAIAPCGMDCSLCIGLQREKERCSGCNGPNKSKPKYCVFCRIKLCEHRPRKGFRFCFACGKFPCRRLRQLDLRYRTRYGMSMIENLQSIEQEGIRKFIAKQKIRWACPKCGSLLSVHRDECQNCGKKRK
jgi:hypothetical protein